MNRNHFASPNATATAWLGGREYDWLSTASASKTVPTTARPTKRRRTSQTASTNTVPTAPIASTRTTQDRTEPSPPQVQERPGPPQERPQEPTQQRPTGLPPQVQERLPSPQERPGPSPAQERPQPPALVQLDGPSEPPPERTSPAQPPVKQESPMGRLPTPRTSMPIEVRSPPRPTPPQEPPNVPTPTSNLPSPQVQYVPAPSDYSCFDRQACLDQVGKMLTSPMSAASRVRCHSLYQAMTNTDHEYMVLHQFMSLAVIGHVPGNNPRIRDAMSHLASIAKVAFGEPPIESSLRDVFCDLPLSLKKLSERDTMHSNHHYIRLNELSNSIVRGWTVFKGSKTPFTVPEFRSLLGLKSPEWQRIANMAKVKLLIGALGIQPDIAKTHQFESKLMGLFQAHQAQANRDAAGRETAETNQFRQEMHKVILQMEKVAKQAGPNVNLDFHQAQHPNVLNHLQSQLQLAQQPNQQREANLNLLQADVQQSQQLAANQQLARQREWMSRMTQLQQNQASFQQRAQNSLASQDQQLGQMTEQQLQRQMAEYRHRQQLQRQQQQIAEEQARARSQSQQNMLFSNQRPNSTLNQHIQQQRPVQSPIQSPGQNLLQRQFNQGPIQHGTSNSPGQPTLAQQAVRNQAQQPHQRRVSVNGTARPQPPGVQQGAQHEKLFQSVVDFAVPPQRLSDGVFHEFEFEVSPNEFANMARGPPHGLAREGSVAYRFRCVRIPASMDVSKDEWMSFPTEWPMGTLLIINGFNVRPQKPHGKWDNVVLAPFIRESTNKITFTVCRRSDEPVVSSFALAVEKINFQTEATITSAVTAPERLLSAASIISKIRSAILPNGDDSDDDLAVTDLRITINLIDPTSASAICNVPVRGLACKHRDCFDLANFLTTRLGIITEVDRWRCPICGADARPTQLVVDGFLVDVRKQLEMRGELATAKAIIVDADGSWSVREEKETQTQRSRSERRASAASPSTSAPANAPAATGAPPETAVNEAPTPSVDSLPFDFNAAIAPLDDSAAIPPEFYEALDMLNSLPQDSVNQVNAAAAAVAMEAASGAPAAARSQGSRSAPVIIDLSDDDDDE
ncbi:hypothetical protein IWZ00DRAFT_342175 [Phyllosticta capitalensis]